MGKDTSTLAMLIGSRICHDLVSPIGAVTNGLELLELSGVPRSPEFDLVMESVANANARIRFFRLAFGVAQQEQTTGADEVNAILHDLHSDGRIRTTGLPPGCYPRAHVRLILLAMLCMETAIPHGGDILLVQKDGAWRVSATGKRLYADPSLWTALDGHARPEALRPAAVQFALLAELAPGENMNVSAQTSEQNVEITISPA